MKKADKRYWKIVISIIAVFFDAGAIFMLIGNNFTVVSMKLLLAIIILVVVLALYCYPVFNMTMQAWRNFKGPEDELFREIDKYRTCWGKNNNNYIRRIRIINLYYSEGGGS